MFTLLYYENEESDDVIGGSTETVQYSIKNISNINALILKQFSLNLVPEMYIIQNATHGAVAMTTVMPLILF